MKLKWKELLLALTLILVLPVFAACGSDEKKEDGEDADKKQSEETEKDDTERSDDKKTEDNKSEDEGKKEDKDSEEAKEDVEIGPFEGNKPADFELVSFQDGKTYKLSDYLGKDPIVITFFASWCGPCRTEMPELKEVYEENKEDGLKVFAVNLGNGDRPEDVEALINDYILSFPVLKDEESDLAFEYGVNSIPVNIFIGRDGLVKKNAVGMQTKESYEENVKAIMESE